MRVLGSWLGWGWCWGWWWLSLQMAFPLVFGLRWLQASASTISRAIFLISSFLLFLLLPTPSFPSVLGLLGVLRSRTVLWHWTMKPTMGDPESTGHPADSSPSIAASWCSLWAPETSPACALFEEWNDPFFHFIGAHWMAIVYQAPYQSPRSTQRIVGIQ